MTKSRRAQITALVKSKGGYRKLAARIGWSVEMLYAVIAWGTRRPSIDLAVKLKEELGVDVTEWPRAKRPKSVSLVSAA